MMTERQRAFREKYVAGISPWYHGLVHVGVMYAAGLGAIVWCVSRTQDARWEWLLDFLYSRWFRVEATGRAAPQSNEQSQSPTPRAEQKSTTTRPSSHFSTQPRERSRSTTSLSFSV